MMVVGLCPCSDLVLSGASPAFGPMRCSACVVLDPKMDQPFLQEPWLHRTAEGPSPVLCLHHFTLLLASPDFPPREIILHSVSVSRSRRNKLPQAGQLTPQKCLVSRVWGQKDTIKMPPGSCLLNLERASPRLSQVPWLRGPRPQPLLPCPTSVFSLVSLPFYKDNSHIGL